MYTLPRRSVAPIVSIADYGQALCRRARAPRPKELTTNVAKELHSSRSTLADWEGTTYVREIRLVVQLAQ